MVRWIAPVVTFTAEEIWKLVPGNDGNETDSVLLQTWYQGLFPLEDTENERDRWQGIMAVRQAVSREIEALRKAGEVGSSLAAEAALWAEGEVRENLEWLGDELRFVLITSAASLGSLADAPEDATRIEVGGGTLALQVRASQHEKCVRCWHYREDVGSNPEHPEICNRCVDNVEGRGETRTRA
jgi:isoleucyl-tRNA synthetase